MGPIAELELAPHLDGGESLLWSGRPRQGLVLRPSDAFVIPFSLMWGGFAVFWEASVLERDAPLFFVLWGIPFVLVGLYMIGGRFFADARLRGRTFYGLTSSRVIIVSGLFSRRVKSLSLRTLSDVTLSERADRSGTISFGPTTPWSSWAGSMPWPGTSQQQAPAFELIAEARSVYNKIREAQKAAG